MFLFGRWSNVESRDRLRWPGSNRNGGRHQIGIPGRIASELAAQLTTAVFTAAFKPLKKQIELAQKSARDLRGAARRSAWRACGGFVRRAPSGVSGPTP